MGEKTWVGDDQSSATSRVLSDESGERERPSSRVYQHITCWNPDGFVQHSIKAASCMS